MSKLKERNLYAFKDTGDIDDVDIYVATVAPASEEGIKIVTDANPDSDDGRSPFMWVLLANGDLLLGVFPQGETYEKLEKIVHADFCRAEQANG
jgi:hypothetical protein